MKVPVLLAVSLWEAIVTLVDEVRRNPTWVVVIMLVVVVLGTFVAQIVR